MRRVLPLLLLPLLLAAACAVPQGPGSQPTDGPTAGVYGPDDLVLRVEVVGGFVPAEYLVTALPTVSVYGDGRVITEGPVIAIYPGPALPNLQVRLITPHGIEELVRLAVAAGVGSGADYGTPSVADAPGTHVIVATSEGVLETNVYALGFDEGVTAAQREARQRLTELVDSLTDLPTTLGPDADDQETPYEPHALAVIANPWGDPNDQLEHAQIAWPGPALPGEPLPGAPSSDIRCVDVTGEQMYAVLEAALWPDANALTPWVFDGEPFRVAFRPLLPDEASCADLV